jgi:hypothetical protein
VNVALNAGRKIIVDDGPDAAEVHAAADELGADEDPDLALAEVAQDTLALLWRPLRVDYLDRKCVVDELVEERGRTLDRLDKYEDRRHERTRRQVLAERKQLARLGAGEDELLLDRGGRDVPGDERMKVRASM